jgi:arylsulfatase A-like enzyme
VLTADHAAQAVESKYNSTTGMYSIPLAFFCPSDTNLRGASGSAGQQIDVLPTVLDYLGYQKPFFAFGESVLDPGKPHRAISFVNNIYQLAEGDYVLLFNGRRATAFYKKGTLEVKKLTDSPEKIISPEEIKIFRQMEKTIKAIVQTYNYCLINNRTTFH